MDLLTTLLSLLSAFAALIAAVIAWRTLLSLKYQLKIEQEPYVVVFDDIKEGERGHRIKVKNVGRGPALGITGCSSQEVKDRNIGFFGSDQPHSKSLYPGERSSWLIDTSRISEFTFIDENGEKYQVFYLFYESQLKKMYRTRIKIKEIDSSLRIVMECSRDEV